MHVADKGEGPVVLLLHGFPELWYSWRRQIISLSSQGYRAVAPDLRGFGDTDAPASISSYNAFHVVGDLIALLDSMSVDEAFLVGHDWGAIMGWYLCMFRPERVKAYVCLSIPFLRRHPQVTTLDGLRALYGEDYYICRFLEPGKIEAEMSKVGVGYVLKNILTTRKMRPPIFPMGEYGSGFNPDTPQNLPSWLSEQDLAYYVSKFEKTGFTGGLNYYRNINLNRELTAPWIDVQVKVPVNFISGELAMLYTNAGVEDYIHGSGLKELVPNLEEVVVQKDVGHFNNQEAAEEISSHIYEFIKKF